jgi:nickel-dependent lactate racemase
MKKIVKGILLLALAAFVVMQFIRPDKNESGYESVKTFESETGVQGELAVMLKAKCYDCHSNQTVYPWYAEIAPASYWLSDHVKDGKKHFNVSAWEQYSAKKKDHKLDELIEMVEDGEMPLDSYTWLHDDITSEEKEALIKWAQLTRLKYQKEISELSK